ncbi:hypothetical protein D3C74_192700 [compost metagenome]
MDNMPAWWVEAIAIEYLNCREYGFNQGGRFWNFNFDKIDEQELTEALNEKKIIIPHGTLMHNLNESVYRTRILELLFSTVPLYICEEESDAIVEGLSSKNRFLFSSNGIDAVDPKLELNPHFIVYENGNFYQWKFAEFESVEGRHYGKFTSQVVDLEVFDQEYERRAQLHEMWVSEKGNTSALIDKIQEHYDWIDSIRNSLLKRLYEIHVEKLKDYKPSKVTENKAPQLSRFESFTIKEGKYHTKSLGAPIFFNSLVAHVKAVNSLYQGCKHEVELIPKLDKIYQESASAVILGASCLESFINELGYKYYADIWDSSGEKMSVDGKIDLILKLKNVENPFIKGVEPAATLGHLIQSRNHLVHNKPKYEQVKKYQNSIVSAMNYYLRKDLIQDLDKRVKLIIETICEKIDTGVPGWLNNPSLWSQDGSA